MNSLNKIGKSALSRIFKPFSKMQNGVEIIRTLHFQNEELNLTKCIFLYEQEDDEIERTITTTRVQIWGIKIGLQDVEISESGEMLGPFLSKNKNWNEDIPPSHIILRESVETFSSINPRGSQCFKSEDVYIYRISQKNVNDIRGWISAQMDNYHEMEDYQGHVTSSNGRSCIG